MAAANVLMDTLLQVQRRNILRITDWKSAHFGVVLSPYLFLSLITGLIGQVAMTLARVTRLMIASSREFIADAEAVRLTHAPEALISALRKIDGRSHVAWIEPQSDARMIDGASVAHPPPIRRSPSASRSWRAMRESPCPIRASFGRSGRRSCRRPSGRAN